MESYHTICTTCFSSDRILTSIGETNLQKIFNFISKDVPSMDSQIIHQVLCWECLAVLKKIMTFKVQIEKVQTYLQDLCKNTFWQIKCCSSLQKITKTTFDKEYYYEENENIDIDNINVLHLKNEDNFSFEEPISPTIDLEHELKSMDVKDISYTYKIKNFNRHRKTPKRKKTIKVKAKSDIKYNLNSNVTFNEELLEDNQPLSELKKDDTKKYVKVSVAKKYDGVIRTVDLSEGEVLAEREKESSKESYLRLPYKCEKCINGFDHEELLRIHIEKRHNENNAYACNVCESTLSSEACYKEHIRRHFKRYDCIECNKRYTSIDSCISHHNEKHSNNALQLTCPDCNYTTNSTRSYRYHRSKHKSETKCKECGKSFVNSSGLRKHMFQIHKTSDRVYKCSECTKVYTGKSGLHAHMVTCHGEFSSSFCVKCRKLFRCEATLRHHLKTHLNHVDKSDRKYQCEECAEKFLTKPQLQRHVDFKHLKTLRHECDQCSKAFMTSAQLRRHVNVVHLKIKGPKDKMCHHCGKGFRTLSVLAAHAKTHDDRSRNSI